MMWRRLLPGVPRRSGPSGRSTWSRARTARAARAATADDLLGAADGREVAAERIHVGGVEEGDATLRGPVEDRDRRLLVALETEGHRAEAEARDLQAGTAELHVSHASIVPTRSRLRAWPGSRRCSPGSGRGSSSRRSSSTISTPRWQAFTASIGCPQMDDVPDDRIAVPVSRSRHRVVGVARVRPEWQGADRTDPAPRRRRGHPRLPRRIRAGRAPPRVPRRQRRRRGRGRSRRRHRLRDVRPHRHAVLLVPRHLRHPRHLHRGRRRPRRPRCTTHHL